MNRVHVKSLGSTNTETREVASTLTKALKQNDKAAVRGILSNMTLSDIQIDALHDVFKRLK